MKITVLSQDNFNTTLRLGNVNDSNVEDDKDFFFISINSTPEANEEFSNSYFKENHSNVLILHFDDVTEDGNVSPFGDDLGKTKAFSEDQAKQIIEFLNKNKDKRACMLHCAAGISRSGAVGAFIADYFRVPFAEYKRTNPQIRPNPHVSSTLNKLFFYDQI